MKRTDTPVLLTVREVSILLRVQRPKVYELIHEGAIDGFKVGADWRVRRDSIENLIGAIPEDFFKSRKIVEDSDPEEAAMENNNPKAQPSVLR